MLHLPNPVAGAAAERCPVLADDPADVILVGPASRELGRDRRRCEEPCVGGISGRLDGSHAPQPGEPLSRPFWAFGGGLAESEAVGSTVTHELDPRQGRSTPAFGLPAKELDILSVEDRGTETGGGVALDG